MSTYQLFQYGCTIALIVYAVVHPHGWPIGLAIGAVVIDVVEWSIKKK